MKVILIGYMTSGKSTIGKQLSARMYLPFIDLDTYIEEKEDAKISEIFEEEGEIAFRLKEHRYLKELLNKEKDSIISLGGGTPCYADNMKVLENAKHTTTIYLQADIQTLVERIKKNKEQRPLVARIKDNELHEFVAKHLFERRYFYEQASEKVKIDNKTVEEIVAEIRILLH